MKMVIDSDGVQRVDTSMSIVKKITDPKFAKEFWGMVVLLVVVPLISCIISTFQTWVLEGVWDWGLILTVLAFEAAPAILAWFKKNFDTERAELQSQIAALKDEINANKVNLSILKYDNEHGLKNTTVV
jgi:hypothetical protein